MYWMLPKNNLVVTSGRTGKYLVFEFNFKHIIVTYSFPTSVVFISFNSHKEVFYILVHS